MPTARMNPDGELSATVFSSHAADRYNLGFQALPWLETVFRYSRLDRYLSGNKGGDLYDRSLSFRVRLFQETDWSPAIAVGVRDILGTGAYGGEYLTVSKRLGDFDVSGGLGWRSLGGLDTFPNPFGWVFPSFKTNETSTSTAGQFSLGKFFHGTDAGIFGGLTWQTPFEGLTLIAELSGDKYTVQRMNRGIDIRTPLNFGFSYEPWQGVQIGGEYLYGSQFGIRVTIFGNAFDSFPAHIGTQPLPMHERTADARNQAELDNLQDATHFYANWPSRDRKRSEKDASAAASQPSLADAVFEPATGMPSRISEAEIFGDSLIVELRGSKSATSCAQWHSVLDAADASRVHSVVFWDPGGSGKIVFCTTRNPMKSNGAKVALIDAVAEDVLEETVAQASPAPSPERKKGYGHALKDKIAADAAAQGIAVSGYRLQGARIEVAYSNGTYRTETESIGRLLRVLMQDAPDDITDFRLVSLNGAIPTRSFLFHRAEIERLYDVSGSADELLPTSDLVAADDHDPIVESGTSMEFPSFSWGLAPGYRQSLFDPDDPYRFGVYGSLSGGVTLTRHWSIGGEFDFNIYNNFNTVTRVSNSVLPHVRSDFASYLKDGTYGVANLTASYFTKLSPDVYFLGKVGYLENMFAGFGGEVLWQPSHKRFSFGAALYAVQQRSFDEFFGLRHYQVITGHVSVYYETPFHGYDIALHTGRYLAGDYGATLEVTRRFDSGIVIGVYATLTNVPFSEFGEGSFDKGFIVRIPVDFLAPLNTPSVVNMDFSPLTRDGGQRLDGEQTLYDATRRTDDSRLLPTWNQVLYP